MVALIEILEILFVAYVEVTPLNWSFLATPWLKGFHSRFSHCSVKYRSKKLGK